MTPSMSEPRRVEPAGHGATVAASDPAALPAVPPEASGAAAGIEPRAGGGAWDLARAQRIARLARAVESGTYRPDALAIAAALLRAMDVAAGRAKVPPPLPS